MNFRVCFRKSEKNQNEISSLDFAPFKNVSGLFTCCQTLRIRNYSYNCRGIDVRSSTAKRRKQTGRLSRAHLPALGAALFKLDRPDRIARVCDCVIDIAAALFNVSGRELRHSGRTNLDISRVRQIAMYVTHVSLGMSMRDVGQGFGRDRTTVLYACHVIEDLRDDEEFDRIVTMTERVVRAAFGSREQG